MLALIDGDELIYACGFASQKIWYFIYINQEEEDGWIYKLPYKKEAESLLEESDDFVCIPNTVLDPEWIAKSNVRNTIQSILDNTGADEYRIFLSGKENFREKIASILPYKGNRDPEAKPIYYDLIKEYLLKEYNAIIVDGMEADDGMSIAQYNDIDEIIYNKCTDDEYLLWYNNEGFDYSRILSKYGNTVICSQDKDLNMVPGWHYNDKGGLYFVEVLKGLKNFYTQMLTGDAIDNIPGLYKLTGKKVFKRIKDDLQSCNTEEELYSYVRTCYMEAFKCDPNNTDIDLLLTELGRLLWMRQYESQLWVYPN